MDISQIKQLAKEHGFRPNKRLGQNFLIDKNIKEKILSSLDFSNERTVLEVGPGFGMMTFDLAERCAHLIAVEKDPRLCEIMTSFFKEKDNIELICQDILDSDLSVLSKGERLVVYGNVPYYITTPIVEKMITERKHVSDLYMVIQEELADRLVASPGSKIYGSISCFVQFYTHAKKLFRITKGCFSPKPKVNSSLLHLEFLEEPSVKVKDEGFMFGLIRKAFSQRRKKILNSLSSGSFLDIDKEELKKLLLSCEIDPLRRAESLSLSDYAHLADKIASYR